MNIERKQELMKQLTRLDIHLQECIARANWSIGPAVSGHAGRRKIVRGDNYVL